MPTATIKCEDCPREVFYSYTTRKPRLCPDCAKRRKTEKAKERKRRQRERQSGNVPTTRSPEKEKQKPAAKTRTVGSPSAALSVGAGSMRGGPSSRPMLGGLYSDLPRDEANARRRRMGLPALAI